MSDPKTKKRYRESPNPGAKCGHQTTGRSTKNGEVVPAHPCQQAAGAGTEHLGFGWCKHHGGTSAMGKAHAARLEAEWLRTKFMVAPEVVSPEDALEHALASTFALFTALKSQLADAGSLDAATAKTLELFAAERDRLERIARTAGGLKIDERRTQLAENQGALMARTLEAVCSSPQLAISPEQRLQLRQVIRHELAAAMEPAALPAPSGGPALNAGDAPM